MLHRAQSSSQNKVKHTLGKLEDLYSNHVSDFNINKQIYFAETNLSLELIKEISAKAWKYLTLATFWPKDISYNPVESGVKVNKYPGFEMEHLLVAKLCWQKTIQGRNSI